jgi:hypothetical protein
MPPTTKTSLTIPPSSIPSLAPPNVRLMPFHLAYTGKAEVDVFFKPRRSGACGLGYPDDGNEETKGEGQKEGVTGRVAAFRGREVHEHLVAIPTGYIGCVISAPPKPTGRTEDVGVAAPKVEEEQVTDAGRPLRKRKAPVASASAGGKGGRTKRKVVPVKRFALDSEDDEPEEAVVAEPEAYDGDVMMDTKDEPLDSAQAPEQDQEAKAEQEQETRQPLEHTESLAIVDTMISLPPPQSPQSPINPPENEVEADVEPASWIHERRLIPEATFSAFSVWYPDEAMYTAICDTIEGDAKEGEANEGEKKEGGDVVRMMSERDEFVRALDEGRRVAEIVHGW